MTTIAFAVVAYLMGSIPFAVVMSRLFDLPDPRSYGSGNPGATNVLRTGKRLAAVFTLLGDAGKGFGAVLLAKLLAPQFGAGEGTIAAVTFAVFIGHLYPLFIGFKGGKGVATALGAMLALEPWLGLALIAVWLAVAAIWRISSLAAICAAAVAPLAAGALLGIGTYTAVVLGISTLVVLRHRSNIAMLLAGKEAKIAQPAPGDPPRGP